MQIFQPNIVFINNDNLFKAAFFFKNKLPIKILEQVAKIPGLGSQAMKKNVEKGKLMVSKAWETCLLFDHFTKNSWVFESNQVEEFSKLMTNEEKKQFIIDPREIEWI